jgi:hypothetical protein
LRTIEPWVCLDSSTGEDLAEEVRKVHFPDFHNWQNHYALEVASELLSVWDLSRTEEKPREEFRQVIASDPSGPDARTHPAF